MTKIQAHRYHDISCGHRVVGHEGKCRFLHGHNYRVHFYCESSALDKVGRVVDFGVIKAKLCMWLEHHWDHRFLAWTEDKLVDFVNRECKLAADGGDAHESFVFVPFNPTAENMAEHLLKRVAPILLKDSGVTLTKVIIEETRKCAVTVGLT